MLAFGEAAEGDGPELLGAALVGLAVGIPVYGGFLLLTRVAYALGDSRTPGAGVARLGASLGAVGMLAAAAAHRRARPPRRWSASPTPLAYAARGGRGWPSACAPRVGSVLGTSASCGPLRARRRRSAWLAWVAMEAWAPDGRVRDAARRRA